MDGHGAQDDCGNCLNQDHPKNRRVYTADGSAPTLTAAHDTMPWLLCDGPRGADYRAGIRFHRRTGHAKA